MSKVRIGVTHRRGSYTETYIHDVTRVTDPVAATIYTLGVDDYLVVPENDMFPIVKHDNISSAVNFVEQIIPDESKGVFR